MNKLNSIALCALITPVLTLSAGSALAGEPTVEDNDREQQSTQHEYSEKGENQYGANTEYDSETALEDINQSHMENRGFLDAIPANGLQASNLIGAEVKTTNDEEVGPVNELIIDSEGQVVAIVIGVGGFLGMGEKDVAIGWDDVTKTGNADDQELRIVMTREELSAAPEFETELEMELEEEFEELDSELDSELDTDNETDY